MNKNLAFLDNGGFEIEYDPDDIVNLSTSDVRMQREYIDRTNGNESKIFDSKAIYAHTYCFQQAVEKMDNRDEVHLR